MGGGTGLLVVAAFIIINFWSGASSADLLGFAGAVIGAAVTVTGSVMILQWQRGAEQREERDLLLELLKDVDAACLPFQVANEAALKARYGTTAREQVDEAQAAIERVHEFRRAMKPKNARMMRASGALSKLAFDDPDLENQVASLAKYPTSADFGFVNALGHDVRRETEAARSMLM